MPIAVVPGVLALLPEYASLEDPCAELREACLAAIGGLGRRVQVVGPPAGARVGRHLVRSLGSSVWPGDLVPAERAPDDSAAEGLAGTLWCGTSLLQEIGPPSGVLVVGNGSAKRTERAPGHLDARAEAFDARLGRALATADAEALRAVDAGLAAELWADVDGLAVLADLLTEDARSEVLYDAAPFGVQYWVISYRPGPRGGPVGRPGGVTP